MPVRNVVFINDAPVNTGVGNNSMLFIDALSPFVDLSIINLSFSPEYKFYKGNLKRFDYFSNPDLNRVIQFIKKIKIDGLDKYVFFGDGAIINFIKNVNKIQKGFVFIHHMNILKNPASYPVIHRIILKRTLKIIENSDLYIITLSKFTKKLIIDFTKIDENRIKTIYPYVNLPNPKNEIVEKLRNKFNGNMPIILAVGTSIPLKNFQTLYSAVKGTDLRVIRLGGKYQKEKKYILDIPNNVVFLGEGNLSLEELSSVYSMADVLAFTSTDEGFGFPLIEAMHFGLPVVGNKCTTVPEIVGDAGILINNPYDPEELREAIYRTLENHTFYKEKIKDREKLFSKDSYINSMLSLLE